MTRTNPVLLAAALLFVTSPPAAAGPAPDVRVRSALAQARFLAAHPDSAFNFGGNSLPSLVRGFSAALDDRDRRAGAQLFVADWADLFGFDAAAGDLVLRAAADAASGTAYRFGQVHQGLPVIDADVVVLVDAASRAVMASNGLAPLGDLQVVFTVSRNDAVAAAMDALGPTTRPRRVARVDRVIANIGGEHRAVWMIDAVTERPAGAWRVFVARDARRVVGIQNRVLTAQGYAYPVCPEAGAYETVTLDDLTGAGFLSGTFVDVHSNCLPGVFGECGDSDRQAAADGQGDFLYAPAEPASTDPFAEVNAYYQLSEMHDYVSQNGLSQMDVQFSISVNYTDSQQGMNCNGGYLGYDAVVLGLCMQSNPAVNFAYDAPVIRHEYVHGLVDRTAAFAYYEIDDHGLVGMPGGLNEGYADTLAAISIGDPLIGRHVAAAFQEGSALRDLSEFKSCPDGIWGETHEDGKVWGSANWAAYKNAGDDPLVGKVVLEGLVMLSSQASFQDAGQVTMQAAAAYSQTIQDAFKKAYEDHGILACAREMEIENSQSLHGWLLNPQMLYIQSGTTPFVMQFKLNVPEGAARLDVTVEALDLYGGADLTSRVNVYINKDSHVSFGPPIQAGWNTGGRSNFSIESPEPGWYFFLPVGMRFGSQTAGYQFSLTPQYVLGAEPDAGLDAGPEDVGLDAGPEDAGVEDTGGDSGAEPSDAGPETDMGPIQDDTGTAQADGGGTPAPDTDSSGDPSGPPSEAAEGSEGGCSCSIITRSGRLGF
ncbi:MAG: hypothetical protein HY897_04150 [Deltaproteobacteria bacterium]|nr:hypothetical protein [Deltaproteobacteria bacterium]